MTRDDLTDRLDDLVDQFEQAKEQSNRTEFDQEEIAEAGRRFNELVKESLENPDGEAAARVSELLTKIRSGSADGDEEEGR